MMTSTTPETTSTTTNDSNPTIVKDDNNNNGVWVGIDLGTSNSACAVWDSTRGSSKWIRLRNIATPIIETNKIGRIVPSAIMLSSSSSLKQDNNSTTIVTPIAEDISSIIPNHFAFVGDTAIKQQQQQQSKLLAENKTNNISEEEEEEGEIEGTLIRSIKRIVGKQWNDLDPEFIQSFPLELVQHMVDENDDDDDDDDDVRVRVTTISSSSTTAVLELRTVEVLAILLQSIRIASEDYFKRNLIKKRLDIPGYDPTTTDNIKDLKVRNVVVGVPAHFSSIQRQVVIDACHLAGFDGHVSTLLESTAAAMAYGLSFIEEDDDDANNDIDKQDEKNYDRNQTVLVVDMGGGTTDVTIATKENNNTKVEKDDTNNNSSIYSVVVTEGDERLGGDDMDQAILEFILKNLNIKNDNNSISLLQRRTLLRSCRIAKEALCTDDKNSNEEVIQFYYNKRNHNIRISKDDLDLIVAPWIVRARCLVQKAAERYQQLQQQDENCNNHNNITEIVLVGGTTRIPAVRNMLQDVFPTVKELCTSLHPMSSVAQGLAIQAAIRSNLVLTHSLKSALMLDSIPHAIGVQVGNGSFIPILKRNMKLPAFNSIPFTLADIYQPGVTIKAVELVITTNQGTNHQDEKEELIPMAKEDFTFLLRRLPNNKMKSLTTRTIDVGMKVDIDGKFIVSIFDELDPEQVRKKERFLKLQSNSEKIIPKEAVSELEYITDLVMAESELSNEQILLFVGCIGAFIIYVITKILFAEELLVVDDDTNGRIF